MKIKQNSSPVNFKAYISPELEHQIERQVSTAGGKLNVKKLQAKVEEQMKRVKGWGNNDMEVIITKNVRGFRCLGLKIFYTPTIQLSHCFEHLSSRTELSQFLALTQKHFLDTENLIENLLKKRKALLSGRKK